MWAGSGYKSNGSCEGIWYGREFRSRSAAHFFIFALFYLDT
jgi:hypothetical protein